MSTWLQAPEGHVQRELHFVDVKYVLQYQDTIFSLQFIWTITVDLRSSYHVTETLRSEREHCVFDMEGYQKKDRHLLRLGVKSDFS